MTRTEADKILADEYGSELPSKSTRQWADEADILRQIIKAQRSKIAALEHRLDEMDGAANTCAHQLEGELAAWAMLAVWLVTAGGILLGAL